MKTFEEYVSTLQKEGGIVNLLFEENIYRLLNLLNRAIALAKDAGVEYALVGGLAVFVYVEESDPSLSMTTRDVNAMIRRSDLPRLLEFAKNHGFVYRHSEGLDMLVPATEKKAVNSVDIVFSGERVRPTQVLPNPQLRPEERLVKGAKVMIIPLADLIQMKLTAYRDKDRVHVRTLDECGLITPVVEQMMLPELKLRLQHVRETE